MSIPGGAFRALVAAVALFLVWRIVHVNAVLYGDDGRPRGRITLASGLAAQVSGAPGALAENPADFLALLAIGEARERAGDASGAGQAYGAARSIAPVEWVVLQASAGYALRHGRTAEGLKDLANLAELYPESRDFVFAALAQLISVPPLGADIASLAKGGPSWAGAFVLHSCPRGVDPGLLVPLLFERITSGRVRREEVSCVTEGLRRRGRWEEAYHVWLNALPRERLADVGHVFNGSFEDVPTGVGFDWMASKAPERQSGHLVEYPSAASGAGKRALRVTYNGKRQAAPAIQQFLAVAPGRYQLSGLARPESLQSVRGLRWSIRCAGGGDGRSEPIGQSERFLGSGEWQRFTFEVSVPRSCAGQVLQLEPVGLGEGTTYVAGKIWFDDLRLVRLR
jgi:hypothetical protein